MNRLLIVDGHAYAYRAFYAIRSLRSPGGLPTNAIYGFVKMLAKMRSQIAPTHLIVVWDGGLSTERVKALPEYKAQRPPMPDDLSPQLDGIVSYLKAAGIASFVQDEVEADDYIACLTQRAALAGMSVVIASSDKDFMQLVSPQVGLLNPNDKSEAIWTDEQVRAKTGVPPSQIVDWLALMGDNVDNIPGVPGVGPKDRCRFVETVRISGGSFPAVMDEVKSDKLREALRHAAADVQRNLKLVRLHDHLQCDFAPDELVEKTVDSGRLAGLFQQWGFNGLLKALEKAGGFSAGSIDLNCKKMNLQNWIKKFNGGRTCGLHWWRQKFFFGQNVTANLISFRSFMFLLSTRRLAICLCWGLLLGLPSAIFGQTNYYSKNGIQYPVVGSLPGDQVFPDAAITTTGGFLVWQDH